MSWDPVFGLVGVPGHKWDAAFEDAIKRVCSETAYEDEVTDRQTDMLLEKEKLVIFLGTWRDGIISMTFPPSGYSESKSVCGYNIK
ncbi:hypothetical protein Pmani_028613 [Petrolisthes manimaculis]|uniref:Uncharacterized protein n=1 Tax=Petrolisthes manimaculis TaxID=1843537 RepID=A0AAE1P0W0_9EUCA|nr:hypothetical protein Pmani_028613 [Petrolisthes manimaculis]